MIVGLLVPVLVFLDDSNNHHLEQQHVAVASPPSIIIAGGTGATSTSLPRLDRLSLSNTVVASTQEEVTPSSEAASRDAPSYRVWDLPNGSVEFHNPFIFDGLTLRSSSSSVQQILESDQSSTVSETSSIALWDPIFLGSGGSGAVFSFSPRPTIIAGNVNSPSRVSSTNDMKRYTVNNNDDRIAIKVSWKRSNESVLKECNILQSLSNVPHVERCLGRPMDYPYENGRSIIALSPVVMETTADDNIGGGITSSIDKVNPGLPQRNAVQCVVETMVQMLKLGVYTIDIQPLIDRRSGEIVFIDFTEADYFSAIGDGDDNSAIVGFCGEMLTLIPERLKGVAVEMLTMAMNNMKENDQPLPEKIIDILESSWLEY